MHPRTILFSLLALGVALASAQDLPERATFLQDVSFPIELEGPPSLQELGDEYVWEKDGNVIPDQTEANFLKADATLADAGIYSLQARRGEELVELAKYDVALVDSTPSGPLAGQVVRNKPFELKILTAGTDLQFQWYRDEVLMPGETKAVLRVKPPIEKAHVYTFRVSRGDLSFDSQLLEVYPITAVPQLRFGQEITPPTFFAGESFSVFALSDMSPTKFHGRFRYLGSNGQRLGGSWGSQAAEIEDWGPEIAIIKGAPRQPGRYELQVWGSNAAGDGPVMVLPITVKAFPAALTGTFAASIPAHDELDGGLGGRIQFTITNGPACSGKVELGALTIPFSCVDFGVLESEAGTGVELSVGGQSLGSCFISVYAGSPCKVVFYNREWMVDRVECDAYNLAAPRAVQTGRYNASVSIWRSSDMTTATPNGFGFAMLDLDRKGRITIKGRLPDGNAFTDRTVYTDVSNRGTSDLGAAPFYQLFAGGAGSLSGSIGLGRFDGPDDFHGTCFGELPYIKMPTDGGPYADGWGSVGVLFNGAKYAPPKRGQRVLGIADGSPNAQFRFSGGDLAEDITQPITLGAKGYTATLAPGVTGKFSFSVDPKTGLITGGFGNSSMGANRRTSSSPASPSVRFSGLLLPSQNQGLGFFTTHEGGRTGQMFFEPLQE